MYRHFIASWCTLSTPTNNHHHCSLQIIIIITHYLRSLFTFLTFLQQDRLKTERRTDDFTPNTEIVFPVSEDLLCHFFKHLLHLHQDHQDNRSQGLWAELVEKEEGGRRMQPGRPAYPHWGSSHPPTSAQTPTRNQKRPQNDKEDATDSLHQLIAFLLERLIKSLSIVNSLQRGQCSRRVRRVCPLPGCLKPIPSALEVWDLWRIGNTGVFTWRLAPPSCIRRYWPRWWLSRTTASVLTLCYMSLPSASLIPGQVTWVVDYSHTSQ